MISSKEEPLPELGHPQQRHMGVSSQILEVLSSGIYSTPENALKELVSNSFDADATTVKIRARPEFSTLTITDDGIGMATQEFVDHFDLISRSEKRALSDLTPKERPYIGRIGIGFIAVSQLCDTMTVVSKRKGTNEKFQADISFKKFRTLEAKAKEFYEVSDYTLTRFADEDSDIGFTTVVLSDLKESFKAQLEDKDFRGERLKFPGMNFEEIMDKLESEVSDSLRREVGGYWQFVLNTANIVPVRYLSDGPLRFIPEKEKTQAVLKRIRLSAERLDFNVDFDGIDLRKPIRLPESSDVEIGITASSGNFEVFPFEEEHQTEEGPLAFSGYIYLQAKRIPRLEQRGLIIRVRNVAIGSPDPDFMGYPYSEKLFLPWTFGEVLVTKGMEEAMNVDRSSFKPTHEHYRLLRVFIHDLLHERVFPSARNRQSLKRAIRELEHQQEQIGKLERFLSARFATKFKVIVGDERSEEPLVLDPPKRELLVFFRNNLYRGRKSQRWALAKFLTLAETERLLPVPKGKSRRDQLIEDLKDLF